MNKKIFAWIFVLLLIFNLALAIGIRPAKTSIESENIQQYSGEFWVVNNEGRNFQVKIYVEGEMSEYVTLTHKTINFKDDDDAQKVEFEINLPDIVPPGTSTANIVVEEEIYGNQPNVISSKVVLKHKIIITGPYPDKYVKAKLNFNEVGDKVEFVSEVENLGKKDIDTLQTTFYINDRKQEKHELKTEEISLSTTENKLLKTTLDKELFLQGEFEVSAITTYDDQKVEVIKNLLVGRPEVEVTYFDPYFVANKINQYSMDLLNLWNKQVENVYVDVEVKNEAGEKVDMFRTKSVDIEGLMGKRIQDYFDARNKDPGSYSFDMIVNFWNTYKMEQKTFHSEILTQEEYEKLDLAPPNLVGLAVGNSNGGVYKIIVWVMLGVLLAGIAFFFLWRKMSKENKREDKEFEF